MSDHSIVLAELALALSKGTVLVTKVWNGALNVTQRMLISEAICRHINEDLRVFFKQHGELIKKSIPLGYEQYTDGIISRAECIIGYLTSLSDSDVKEDVDTLYFMLFRLEGNLRDIYCPGEGCLFNGTLS